MISVKHNVAQLLSKLPDDCTYEDIQYHLYVIEKINKGIQRAEKEGVLTQEEVEKSLEKWRIK